MRKQEVGTEREAAPEESRDGTDRAREPGTVETLPSLRSDTNQMLAAQTFYRFSGFVMMMALSRALPPHEIGVFFYSASLAETFLLIANLNLNASLMRRIAAAPQSAEQALGGVLAYRLLSAPIYLLVCALAGALFAGPVWKFLLMAALFTLLEDLYGVFAAVFLARRRIRYNVGIGISVQVVFLAALLLGLLRFPSLTFVLGVHLFRSGALALLAAVVCSRRLVRLRPRWNLQHLLENRHLLAVSFLTTLRTRADTLLLGALSGFQAVGDFNLAARAVLAFDFIPMSFGLALFPRLAAKGPSRDNLRTLSHAVRQVAGIGLCGAVVALVFAEPICRLLYGGNAPSVVPLLRGLAALMPLSFVCALWTQALQALSQDRRVLQSVLLGAFSSLGMGLALIPRLGPQGAVLAQALATTLRLIFLWRQIARTRTLCSEWMPMS